jgi:hypothetical protein
VTRSVLNRGDDVDGAAGWFQRGFLPSALVRQVLYVVGQNLGGDAAHRGSACSPGTRGAVFRRSARRTSWTTACAERFVLTARPGPATLPRTSPRSGSIAGPSLAALSMNTSELPKAQVKTGGRVLEPHRPRAPRRADGRRLSLSSGACKMKTSNWMCSLLSGRSPLEGCFEQEMYFTTSFLRRNTWPYWPHTRHGRRS